MLGTLPRRTVRADLVVYLLFKYGYRFMKTAITGTKTVSSDRLLKALRDRYLSRHVLYEGPRVRSVFSSACNSGAKD